MTTTSPSSLKHLYYGSFQELETFSQQAALLPCLPLDVMTWPAFMPLESLDTTGGSGLARPWLERLNQSLACQHPVLFTVVLGALVNLTLLWGLLNPVGA